MITFKIASAAPGRSSGLSNFLGLPSSDIERVTKPHKDNATRVSLPIPFLPLCMAQNYLFVCSSASVTG